MEVVRNACRLTLKSLKRDLSIEGRINISGSQGIECEGMGEWRWCLPMLVLNSLKINASMGLLIVVIHYVQGFG